METLNEYYGFTGDYARLAAAAPELEPGRVTAVYRELFQTVTPQGGAPARLSGGYFQRARAAALGEGPQPDYPTVGDFVLMRPNPGGEWMIEQVLPRKSKFSRTDSSGHAEGYVKTILEQVVAANFDTVLILTSLNQNFSPARIQRYVVAAWESGAGAAVVLTKADLVDDWAGQVAQVEAAAPGVEVLAVSAHTGYGLGGLAPYAQPGKTLALLGSSGVGKSSLVNALAGREAMQVKAIRENDGRGRHTTTHRQLLMMPGGYTMIDTPGMRELGLWDAGAGLGESFADVEALFAWCRFANCGHQSEPGCAVAQALADGALDAARWQSYLRLQREVRFTQRAAAKHRPRVGQRRSEKRAAGKRQTAEDG